MLGLEICRHDLRTFLQGFINGCCDRDEAEAKLKHSESEISMFKEGFSQQILGPNNSTPFTFKFLSFDKIKIVLYAEQNEKYGYFL